MSRHMQNPDIFNIRGILKTLSNIKQDEAYWKPDIVRTVYSDISKHIQEN